MVRSLTIQFAISIKRTNTPHLRRISFLSLNLTDLLTKADRKASFDEVVVNPVPRIELLDEIAAEFELDGSSDDDFADGLVEG